MKFGVSEAPRVALVTFVDSAGKPLEVSSQGRLEGSDETFVVGYDGQAYIRDLSASSVVSIGSPNGSSCRAEFGFETKPGEQVVTMGWNIAGAARGA